MRPYIFCFFILLLISPTYTYAQTMYTANATSQVVTFVAGDDTTTNLTIFEDTRTFIREVGDIFIDLLIATTGFDAVHTTGDTITIRFWVKVDGTNYRQIDNAVFTDNSITNNAAVKRFITTRPFKVTAAVSADRGAYSLQYAYCYFTKND